MTVMMKSRTLTSLFLIVSLFFIAQVSYAQRTYLYQAVKKVSDSGVAEKMNYSVYFTFSGNALYQSDEDGNLATSPLIGKAPVYYLFETIDGNMYYYYVSPISGKPDRSSGKIVSPDYSVINHFSKTSHSTMVYHRQSEVERDQIPGLIR